MVSWTEAAEGGSLLQLELTVPKPLAAEREQPAAHCLKVRFDHSGVLAGEAELEPLSVLVADLSAVAVRANALPVLVRELLARLAASGSAAVLDPAPRELPSRKRERPAEVYDTEPAAPTAQPPAASPLPAASAAHAAPSPAAPLAAPLAAHAPSSSPASFARAAVAAIDAVVPAPAAQPLHLPAAVGEAEPPARAQPAAAPSTPAAPSPADVPTEPADDSAPRAVRRKSASRKSFSRKSLDANELRRALGPAYSPCGRAEKAGAAANPKAAILGLQAEEPVVELTLRSTDGALQLRVLSDGSVLRADGTVLAYVEADGSVGSASMEYLGEVSNATGWICDADEQLIAILDRGTVNVKDTSGSTLAEFDSQGIVKGHRGMACGKLEGFTYAHMHLAAALVTLVLPEFLVEIATTITAAATATPAAPATRRDAAQLAAESNGSRKRPRALSVRPRKSHRRIDVAVSDSASAPVAAEANGFGAHVTRHRVRVSSMVEGETGSYRRGCAPVQAAQRAQLQML
ncbi:hypothetical protein T492DRAFT_882429 [Pavlovales sp. CCMP2436]|nr:hypothetical protein T492DRAFT_882429 [Pavlovales sp. CCMP2436]